MNYHITVNGVPHCQAPVYSMMKEAELSATQMCHCACVCGYGERILEAEADAAKLAQALPDVVVKVAEGNCGEDPWWGTSEGQVAIEVEDEMNDYRDEPERQRDAYAEELRRTKVELETLKASIVDFADKMGAMMRDYELPEECNGIICGQLDQINARLEKPNERE